MEIPSAVVEAFTAFASNPAFFALPLAVTNTTLGALPPVAYPQDPKHTFQQALNQLDSVLSPRTALYLILRHGELPVAITYVPYLADADLRALLLKNRYALVTALGQEQISSSVICKEIGEITDARSWDERSEKGGSWGGDMDEHADACEKVEVTGDGVQDLGHKRNKCRLCDRRMKNKIDEEALDALKNIVEDGDCVQLCVNISTEVLQLNFESNDLSPADVLARLPTDKPSFTFYRHSSKGRLYFIFCSPDSANVKERMKHTLAIPGLINIIAKDNGINVDQKLEIHDPDELDFDQKDERIGKFRSMYLRNDFAGTESQWEGMDKEQKILDAVR